LYQRQVYLEHLVSRQLNRLAVLSLKIKACYFHPNLWFESPSCLWNRCLISSKWGFEIGTAKEATTFWTKFIKGHENGCFWPSVQISRMASPRISRHQWFIRNFLAVFGLFCTVNELRFKDVGYETSKKSSPETEPNFVAFIRVFSMTISKQKISKGEAPNLKRAFGQLRSYCH